MKKWFKKNKGLLTVLGVTIVSATVTVVSYKGIVKMVNISRNNMLKVVENNLKLVADGEFIDIIVGNRTDDFNRTVISKRWTKHNGEVMYLGKIKEVIELSDEERMAKQLSNISKSINNAIKQITSK